MKFDSTLLLLFVTLSLPIAASQEEPAAETQVVWSGTPRAELTSELQRALELPAGELIQEVARIKVRLRTQRDFDIAWQELSALRLRAARRDALDVATVLAITRARVDLKVQQGLTQAARAVAIIPLPTAGEVRALLDPPTIEVPRAEWTRALLGDARALLLAGEAAPGPSQEGSGAVEEERWLSERIGPVELQYMERTCGTPGRLLAEFVEGRLYNDDYAEVRALGIQATPALVLLAIEDPGFENQRDLESDPFGLLVVTDESAAANLALAWLDRGGAAWRRRVLHWIDEQEVHARDHSWLSIGRGERVIAGQPRHPAWSEVLAKILSDEQLRTDALVELSSVSAWDGLSPLLQTKLVQLMEEDEGVHAKLVLDAVHHDFGVPSAAPIFLAGLRSSRAEIRIECARQLSRLEIPPQALRAHAGDADPSVRGFVAESLHAHNVSVLYCGSRGYPQAKPRHRAGDFTTSDFTLLETLAADRDTAVREKALAALLSRQEITKSLVERAASSPVVELREKLARGAPAWYVEGSQKSKAVLTRLLADPAAQVRAALATEGLVLLPSDVQMQIVMELAQDSDRWVLQALDAQLELLALEMSVDTFLAGLPLRLANPVAPFLPHGGNYSGWSSLLGQGRDVRITLALIEVGLDHGIDRLVESCVRTIPKQHLGRTDVTAFRFLSGLDVEHRVALYDWFEQSVVAIELDGRLISWGLQRLGDVDACRLALSSSRNPCNWVWAATRREIARGATDLADLCIPIFGDANRPMSDRLRAGALVDPLVSRADQDRFLELLLTLDPSMHEWEIALISGVVAASSRGNALFLAALQSESMPESILRELAEGFDQDQPESDRAAVAMLEHWRTSREQRGFMQAAIEHLGASDLALEHADALIAISRNPLFADWAVQAMARHTDTRFLKPLGAAIGVVQPGNNVAIQALLRYGTPEAAQQLRAGLLVLEIDGRKELVEALDSLERYWEMERKWSSRALGTREEALAELVGMLTNVEAAVRAEAARSLAAFGALESLPKLIRLLKDEDERVRSAAREAIDRLQNPQPIVEDPGDGGAE